MSNNDNLIRFIIYNVKLGGICYSVIHFRIILLCMGTAMNNRRKNFGVFKN